MNRGWAPGVRSGPGVADRVLDPSFHPSQTGTSHQRQVIRHGRPPHAIARSLHRPQRRQRSPPSQRHPALRRSAGRPRRLAPCSQQQPVIPERARLQSCRRLHDREGKIASRVAVGALGADLELERGTLRKPESPAQHASAAHDVRLADRQVRLKPSARGHEREGIPVVERTSLFPRPTHAQPPGQRGAEFQTYAALGESRLVVVASVRSPDEAPERVRHVSVRPRVVRSNRHSAPQSQLMTPQRPAQLDIAVDIGAYAAIPDPGASVWQPGRGTAPELDTPGHGERVHAVVTRDQKALQAGQPQGRIAPWAHDQERALPSGLDPVVVQRGVDGGCAEPGQRRAVKAAVQRDHRSVDPPTGPRENIALNPD